MRHRTVLPAVILSVSLLAVAALCFAEDQASGTIAVTLTVEPSCRVAVAVGDDEPPYLECGASMPSGPQPRVEVTPPAPLPTSTTPAQPASTDDLVTINF